MLLIIVRIAKFTFFSNPFKKGNQISGYKMTINKENLKKIVADLDSLKNLIEFFSTQDEVPAIEVDIVKRKLQDIYLLFNSTSEAQAVVGKKAEKPIEVEVKKEVKPIESVGQKEAVVFEIEKEVISRPPVVEEKNSKEEHQIENEKLNKPESSNQGATLSDKLKSNNISLNERLSSNKGNDLSSRLQKGAIRDLNEAIGLNDKFLYIKSLFNGDAHKFREAIEYFNEARNISDAETYIASNFNWNMNDETAQQFLGLVQRKLQNNG